MQIHGDLKSGNCLKVKYTADWLGLAYQWVDVDILAGESRGPAFLAHNPAGQVPLVIFDDGRALAQSNAIISYLAEGSVLLPSDGFARAKLFEWPVLGAVQPRAGDRRVPLPDALSRPLGGGPRGRQGRPRRRVHWP